MASRLHNLSDYNPNSLPARETLARQRYLVVVADWNSEITYALAEGAINCFRENGVEDIDIVHVPGAVELTYAAARALDTLSSQSDYYCYYNAIVVIGCVIQGDTPHFDYVCQSVTNGVAQLNARGEVPVVFSVLTTLNKQQALDRAGGVLGNKGVEGAFTAMRMANLQTEFA